MKALVFDQSLGLAQVPAPASDGEAVIRTLVTGICKTDLELTRGYHGFKGIPGHEFVGVVEEAPRPEWVGRRVVGEINCGCPECPDSRHCPHRTVLGIRGRDGAMAEKFRLPVENLLEVPSSLPDEVAVFTEPLAAAFRILEQTAIGPEQAVLVLGDGKLGNLIAQTLAATGCRLLVVGKHREKLGLLWDLGIAVRQLESFVGGLTRSWDLVVEATGSASGLDLALRAVVPRGRVVLKSTIAAPVTAHLAPLVVHEIQVLGSRCGRFAPALEALAQGKIVVEPLIEDRYPLERGPEAFEHAARPGARKILLTTG